MHASAWYFPQSSGGTEVYVQALASALRELDYESHVLAALDGDREEDYLWHGVPVHRYPVHPPCDAGHLRGERPHGGFDRFRSWLERHRPDVFHQHAWSYGCGIHHLRWARALGIPVAITVHVPGMICLRGTAMNFGRRACDAIFEERRCARCWLQRRGAGPVTREVLGAIPAGLSGLAARGLPASRATSALATRWLTVRHGETMREGFELADRVIAVCEWLHGALRNNGVAQHKLLLSRQGIAEDFVATSEARGRPTPRRLGFLGREDPVKGLHVLVEAFRHLPPELPVELEVHAVGEADADYRAELHARVREEPRIHLLPAIERHQIYAVLARFDALMVPSQWMETGPLVVLEAAAAAVPVIGSDLGGVRELVVPGANGWLVAHDDPRAWAGAIEGFVRGDIVLQSRGTAPRVRTIKEAATDMHSMYQSLQ